MPKWLTIDRKLSLAKIILAYSSKLSGWKVDLDTGKIYNPEYEEHFEALVKYWRSGDRLDDRLAWLEEQKAIHSLGEKAYPLRGRFSNIAQAIWHDRQPVYYIEAIGMSGVTLKPFAKVKIGSSFMRLHVDLGDSLKRTPTLSKNARRKAIRYGKALPLDSERKVNELVKLAVKDYLK